MQFDYVYANMQTKVTFDVDSEDMFGKLTDKEILVLQQLIYMTLQTFSYVRGLYAADAIRAKKYKDCETHNCQCTCHGG